MGSESTPSGKQSSRPNKRTRHNKGWNICIGAFDVPDRRKIPEAAIIMKTRKGVALSYAPERLAVELFGKKAECPLQDTQIL